MRFQKGNKFGKGRPKLSLTKPEMLLPAAFANAGVNWQKDLIRLYRVMQRRPLSKEEHTHLKLLLELMPYMVSKVVLKDFEKGTASSPAGSAAMAEQTAALIKQLENDSK